MGSLKRKNFLVDEKALERAKRILGAKTESDAVPQKRRKWQQKYG